MILVIKVIKILTDLGTEYLQFNEQIADQIKKEKLIELFLFIELSISS
jgi:hypothetical protein